MKRIVCIKLSRSAKVCTAICTLMAWVLSLCSILPMPAAHACCKLPNAHKMSAAMPCCVAQPAAQLAGKTPVPGGDPDFTAFVPVPASAPQLLTADAPDSISWLASAHVPNLQTRRYLELGVLLN